ncbi:Erg28 like protein-domain-containing protein [Zopfochytrium polystomum]|nr:Erg28 like protein-domain-containing protein [Zopfochytrium polystomum]
MAVPSKKEAARGPLLPPGVFPKLLLLVGAAAIYNSLQCFVPAWRVTSRIYSLKPHEVSGLASRMMGTWTLTSAVVRCYCAYNMSNKEVYKVCMWTFLIACASFSSEVFLFETAPITSAGVWPVFLISTFSFTWMLLNYRKYTDVGARRK